MNTNIIHYWVVQRVGLPDTLCETMTRGDFIATAREDVTCAECLKKLKGNK